MAGTYDRPRNHDLRTEPQGLEAFRASVRCMECSRFDEQGFALPAGRCWAPLVGTPCAQCGTPA